MAKEKRQRRGVLETIVYKREWGNIYIPGIVLDGMDVNEYMTLADVLAIAKYEFGRRKLEDIHVRGDSSGNISLSVVTEDQIAESQDEDYKKYNKKVVRRYLSRNPSVLR